MTTSFRIAPSAKRAIVRMLMTATAITAVVISPAALAQHRAPFGTADEAKTMLMKAVAAVKGDKVRALAMFSEAKVDFWIAICIRFV